MLNINSAVVIGVSLLTVLMALFLWLKYKRSESLVQTVEFYPPDGLTPAEIGYALDENLEDREIMSMVYYLADKGYISIKSSNKGILLKKIRDIDEGEPDYLTTFMGAYFPGQAKVFDMKNAPHDFIKQFAQAWIQVQIGYEKKYGEVYKNESFTRRFVCIIFAIINMVVCCMALMEVAAFALVYIPAFFTTGGMLAAWKGYDNYHVKPSMGKLLIALGAILYETGIGLVLLMTELSLARIDVATFFVAEAAIFILSMVMATRSDKNAELMMKIYGFRDFIKDAEYDRLVLLSQEDPEYYYHILPYAVVFGMEGKWSKHLDKLTIQNLTTKREGW
jgi:Ca2+/Na+ antiporter